MKTNPWEAIVNMIKSQKVDLIFGIGDTDLQLFAEKRSEPRMSRCQGIYFVYSLFRKVQFICYRRYNEF